MRIIKPTQSLDWERLWAPYDEATYQEALAAVNPEDIVLEIGAGDLRLARRLAKTARLVYAIEIQAGLLENKNVGDEPLPTNLIPIIADARKYPFPSGVTCGVLLMRHCTSFRLYAEKLKAAGCGRLVTNARWRMGVEVVDLQAPRMPYNMLNLGWYACWCGATGFKPGVADTITAEIESICYEVIDCPKCTSSN